MILYSYFRSSAAYRVRIALNLKGIDHELRCVNLLDDGGEQRKPEYFEINPQGLVPTVVDGDTVLTQSLAILEYIEETHPQPPLLPPAAKDRAHVRALADIIACDIHPLNNLRVVNFIKHTAGPNEGIHLLWYRYWLYEGFFAFQELLKRRAAPGSYCFGDSPTLADVCLIPQIYNALRFDFNLALFPVLAAIYERCLELDAFARAAPENQPDCPGRAAAMPGDFRRGQAGVASK